ncbi:MAG: LysE family translocator, partial [Selenomonadaceae bacterium]|nr:LysE family translocator [Selenomonadaceae bacterium]
MDATTFMYFLTASILLTLAPGPDILYLLTKSLSDGARSGIILACGLVSGIVFHTLLVMLGVAALIKSSATALTLLKIFGAAYLLFLAAGAFKSARAAKKFSLTRAGAKIPSAALYKRGVLMNVLNPKVLLFFLAFLPQFVDLNADGAS